MSHATIDAAARRIAEHVRAAGPERIEVILHGGEPLLAGFERIAYAVTAVRSAVRSAVAPPAAEEQAARQQAEAIRALLAEDRRAEAIELFLAPTGMPQRMVDQMSNDPAVQAIAHTLPHDPFEVVSASSRGGATPAEQAAGVRIPTLLLCGGASLAWMIDTGTQLAAAMPNGHHHLMPSQPHIVPPHVLAPVLTEPSDRSDPCSTRPATPSPRPQTLLLRSRPHRLRHQHRRHPTRDQLGVLIICKSLAPDPVPDRLRMRCNGSAGILSAGLRVPAAVSIEVGVLLPTSTPDPAQPIIGDVIASARFAEEAGLDSVWATDHLIASAPMLDSGIVLAAAAGATRRIGIGYNVMLLALRRVAWAAKQISTLQLVSNDRLALGIGTGNPAHGDIGWRAAGMPFEGRGRRTDGALRLLPGLITGEPTVLEDGTEVTLLPGAKMPPVLVAGNGAAALRRASAFGDGWIPMRLSPPELTAGLAELKTLAEANGRPTPAATVVAPQLDADDPKAAAHRLQEYADAGAERVILPPTSPDWRRDYEFAAEIRQAL